ncbi:helix-turn-helix transcriptional regulator [Anditalea andensis]|uniref:HTH deoR-type domain-containing protein n=1 Tax=Anditalea andensis TaxID=1048983 RepID=A0A074L2A5_9BACT|nr:YafY family protein [Anditalea andensis]KEO75304.1 hypothetical protein EL17_01820 [Anditalea andensis]
MNRLDRLTAILTQIQSKRWITSHEIAKRFNITIRTVYRDIRALEEAGVPIISEAGKGYSLIEGYRLPPVMFTREEALSFVLADKLLENISDKESGKQFTSALFKIKSVLKSSEKDTLDSMGPQVKIISRINPTQGQDNTLHIILNSLSSKKVLEMQYLSFDKAEVTLREAEPIGIYYSFEQWYFIGWCRLRKAYRTFRLDRIQSISMKDGNYTTPHPSLKDYLDKIKKEQKLTKVVLSIDHSMRKYIQVEKYKWGFVMETDKGNAMELTFMTSSLEGFTRWALMMGDFIKVIEPQMLITMMKQLLAQIASKIEKNEQNPELLT